MAKKASAGPVKSMQVTGKAVSAAPKPAQGSGLVKKMQDTGRATDYQSVSKEKK